MQNLTNPSNGEKSTIFKTMKKLFSRTKNETMEIEDKTNLLKHICSVRREAIKQRNKAVSKQLRNDELLKMLIYGIERSFAVQISECSEEHPRTRERQANTLSKLSESIKRSNEAIRKLNNIIIHCSEQMDTIENM